MERMKFETPDMVAGNVEKIGAMFPNCVTEALDEEKSTPDKPVYKKAINFELLRQMLSGDVVEGDEAYEFTWVGKKASIVEANKPIRATLRPCPEESVNWDTTENLYIEGDNLQVLKLLQESYLGKVKMIYIDPPYNTGHDFIYPDSYKMNDDEYNSGTGYFNENGEVNYTRENTITEGEYHSDWCSMVYSRLTVARSFLADDGIIFISIDDTELDNLLKICDEVFGEKHFINVFMWLHGKGKKDTWSRSLAQYIVAYAKNKNKLPPWSNEVFTNYTFSNPDDDPKGKWFSGSLSFSEERSNPNHPNYFSITSPTGIIWTRQWQVSKDEMDELIKEGDISWGDPKKCDGVPRRKIRPSTIDVIPGNIIDSVGTTRSASKDLEKLMGCNCFDYPKPVDLIKQLLTFTQIGSECIVMDFFSGSATTADAVFQCNLDDNGNRKFITVQIPEPCDEKSEAYKAGYKTICDIGKERIRRAGKKIKEESPLTTQDLDIGFRVLKLDSTNMKDVYYNPADITQTGLLDMVSNIKEDRNDLDLLFGCLIDWGLPLSLPYTSETIDGCTVHTYNDGDLIACFDTDIPDSVIRTIAKRKPLRAVFRDAGFANSPAKINVFEIFKLLAPDTSVRVI